MRRNTVILELVDNLCLLLIVENTGSQSITLVLVSTETELVGHTCAFRVLHILLGWIKAGCRCECCRIYTTKAPGAVTHVIDLVSTTYGVTGIVDDVVNFSIQVTTCVNNIQHAHATIDGPGCQAKIIIVFIGSETNSLVIGTCCRVIGKHALSTQGLLRVLHYHIPVFVDVVGDTKSSTGILRIVKIIFDQGAVVRSNK